MVVFHQQQEGAPPGGRRLFGVKGKGMVGLAGLGAPMPPGFVLTTRLAPTAVTDGGGLAAPVLKALQEGLEQLQTLTERTLGDTGHPLLLSVRTSPPAEQPGLMSTVHGIGITLETVPALGQALGDARAAWDVYRRFAQSFGTHVLELKPDGFDDLLTKAVDEDALDGEHELDTAAMEQLARAFDQYCREQGRPLPQDPTEQLQLAVEKGFRSWNTPRAREYRRFQALDDESGTAIVLQAMALGTLDETSGAGSFATRVPASGEKTLHGQFLPVAQVADLTAGTRMTESIQSLGDSRPELLAELSDWADRLERHFEDAVQVQFVVDRGHLLLVGCVSAPRTPTASLQIALDLVDAGIATERGALRHVDPKVIDLLMHPRLDRSSDPEPATKGLAASPGSAVGEVVFFAEHAEELAAHGRRTILVRHETTPEDIGGLSVAEGILTATGGLTSHAAVVARGMGKCCVVGASNISINYHLNEMTIGDAVIKRGDWVSLDGNTGEIFLGQLPQITPSLEGDLARMLAWADASRDMGVMANADTAGDARRALELGAEGIGLCRTEHMFFDMERIPIFRKMILAVDQIGRSAALADLLPMQRRDFMDLFRVMDGRPVTIRLLDPPLNEFLPRGVRSQTRMSRAMGIPLEVIQRRTEVLSENNPMLGHRGCRLAITYPEIYQMQVRAIAEAACIVKKEGVKPNPEIMVPLVAVSRELAVLRGEIQVLVDRVMEEMGETVPIKIGTMIETPRAAVCAGSIAQFADFYSFGTNDLTQMGFGFSRDDANMFLPLYLEKNVLEADPFISLDREGIGAMVRMAVQAGRATNPQLKLGICGEHGGDPTSVAFFHGVGLDYVSCSPFRVPVARLSAAQAAIEADEG